MKLIDICSRNLFPAYRLSMPDSHYCIHLDVHRYRRIGYRPIYIRVMGDEFSVFEWQPTADNLLADDWERTRTQYEDFWQKGTEYWGIK